MGSSITIAGLAPEQWELYRDIRLHSLQDEPQAFGRSYAEEQVFPQEKWVERIDNPYNLVAFDGDSPVGTISAYTAEEMQKKIAVVVGVFVLRSHRGMGIGSLLLQAVLEKLAADQSISAIQLTVNVDQKAAVQLYERFGFAVVDQHSMILGDGLTHEEYLMELKQKTPPPKVEVFQ